MQSMASKRPKCVVRCGSATPSSSISSQTSFFSVDGKIKMIYNLQIISDPVVLCSTGQIYCYRTLKSWFKAGNWLCPRTNISVADAQLTRVPVLKQRITAWRLRHGMGPIPEEGSSINDLKGKSEL